MTSIAHHFLNQDTCVFISIIKKSCNGFLRPFTKIKHIFIQPSLKAAAKLYPFVCARVSAGGLCSMSSDLNTVAPVSSYFKPPPYSTGLYSAVINCCLLLHLLSWRSKIKINSSYPAIRVYLHTLHV